MVKYKYNKYFLWYFFIHCVYFKNQCEFRIPIYNLLIYYFSRSRNLPSNQQGKHFYKIILEAYNLFRKKIYQIKDIRRWDPDTLKCRPENNLICEFHRNHSNYFQENGSTEINKNFLFNIIRFIYLLYVIIGMTWKSNRNKLNKNIKVNISHFLLNVKNVILKYKKYMLILLLLGV